MRCQITNGFAHTYSTDASLVLLRSIVNPNDVIVTHTFDSREAAQAFFATPELKKAMSQTGVDADFAEISYFDEVETAALGWRLVRGDSRSALLRRRGPAHL